MTEKQKFYRLLSLVCEDLPTSAISDAIAGGYKVNAVQLIHVRQGRTINLPHLVKLIEVGLPAFDIPEYLRPATPAPAGASLTLDLKPLA
jgi:hypothetical protein